MSRAAIDIGTNSVKLLVLDEHGRQLVRDIATTRLGESLAKTGKLHDDAIARTATQVGDFVEKARQMGATDISVTGTAACRRASNTDTLASAIMSIAGIPLRILSEADEALFGFIGARSVLTPGAPSVVIDIGGGSTEFTVGVESPEFSVSIPFGAVTVTETWLHHDPPRPEELTNAIGEVQDALEEIFRIHPSLASALHHVGIAGTFVTAAAVEIGLDIWDESALQGFVLTREAAEDVFRTMATESLAERKLNPGLPAERADIIVGGMCVVVAIMRRLALGEIIISTRGLVDGVLASERMSP